MELVTGYARDPKLNSSFKYLAKSVFGIDFTGWEEKGQRDGSYHCFSFSDGGEIVANVSATELTLVQNGRSLSAVQLGTVMTRPDYRLKGLAGRLIRHVIETYHDKSALIYLYANSSVSGFYPKFGFERRTQTLFCRDAEFLKPEQLHIRQLDIDNPDDFQLLEGFAKAAVPVNRTFGLAGYPSVCMYNCMYNFRYDLYYIEEIKTIIVSSKDDGSVHIYDIMSKNAVPEDRVFAAVGSRAEEIVTHFLPEDTEFRPVPVCDPDDNLFIMPLGIQLPDAFAFPETSHT